MSLSATGLDPAGGCPHTAIREGASIGLVAVLHAAFPHLDPVFIESGGGDPAAIFSPERADLTLCVVAVVAGEDIPRKGDPGITRSDLPIIDKTALAPLVGLELGVMDGDARRMRGERPSLFADLGADQGVAEVARLIETRGGRWRTPEPVARGREDRMESHHPAGAMMRRSGRLPLVASLPCSRVTRTGPRCRPAPRRPATSRVS